MPIPGLISIIMLSLTASILFPFRLLIDDTKFVKVRPKILPFLFTTMRRYSVKKRGMPVALFWCQLSAYLLVLVSLILGVIGIVCEWVDPLLIPKIMLFTIGADIITVSTIMEKLSEKRDHIPNYKPRKPKKKKGILYDYI